MKSESVSHIKLGIEVIETRDGFLFECDGHVAGPYSDPYSIEPLELAGRLEVDPETALKARLKAVEIYVERELGFEELSELLGITIIRDDVNKVITFLAMLSAYTEEDQFNVSFRAESSTGKSYIPLELARLFPPEDVIEIAYSSPTAFWHDRGEYDQDEGVIRIDLHRKILIFVDMPHDQLLERLRPLLSHDRKELTYKITDKREKAGLRTKTVIIQGFPAVIFCTGYLKLDEQEATRMILLSPETSQEKIREAIYLRATREANRRAFEELVERDPRRKMLRERIKRIKQANILDVVIEDPEEIAKRFIESRKRLKPRHMRDIARLLSIIKAFALLNFSHREKLHEGPSGTIIKASQKDVENAFKVWSMIAEPQEFCVSPFVYQVFKEIIEPLAQKKSITDPIRGLTKTEIMQAFLEKYGRPLSRIRLDRDILPSLEAAGLIETQPDPRDRRRTIIVPTTLLEDTPPFDDTFQSLNSGDVGDDSALYKVKNVSREGGVELSPQSDMSGGEGHD